MPLPKTIPLKTHTVVYVYDTAYYLRNRVEVSYGRYLGGDLMMLTY